MNVEIGGFIDKSKNEDIDGYSSLRLDDQKCNNYKNNDNIAILIGVHNRDSDPYQIKSELNDLGFLNVYTPIEYYDELPDGIQNPYWLAKSDFYKENIDNIMYVYSKIENKEVLIDILKYRIGHTTILKYAKNYSQYRPEPIIRNMVFSNFLDAGAYNGDTIKDFIMAGINVANYYAYEPDLKNYTDLANSVRTYNFKKYLFPSGLSDINGKLNFLSHGEAGMCVLQPNIGEKYETVPVIKLDDSLMGDVAIDFIKMDIEGLENSAILGARNIINTLKPSLAICVYHKPDDLWTILKSIENIAPGIYKYYLYQHELNTFEVVLYAIPTLKCI